MAQLGEVVTFGGGSGVPLIAVSEAHREESVVCSNGDGAIAVYDVPTRLSILSWPLSSPDSLTVPACYIPTAGLYMAVKNNEELIYWDQSVTFASDFKVLQLSQTVYSLLATPTNPCVIVVYNTNALEILRISDGEVSMVISKKRRMKKTRGSQMSVCGSVMILHNGTPHVVIVYKASGQYHVTLYAVQAEEGGVQVEELGRIDIENDMGLGDLCSLVQTTSCLYSTWSSGVICRTDLNLLISKLLFRLDPLAELGTPTGLTCFGDESIITLSGQKLSVFETKYCTLQTSLELQHSVQTLSQCCHGYLFMFTCSGELQGCTISSDGPRPSLASALGKGRLAGNVHESLIGEVESIESDKLRDRIQLFMSQTSSNEKLKICRKLLKDVSSPLVLSMILQITKFLLVEESRDIVEESCDSGDSGDQPTSAKWHRKELLVVIRAKVFPVSLSGDLYRKALICSDWSLIVESLDLVTCVPEGVLMDLIEALLRLPSDFSVSLSKETFLRDPILWKLLSLPRNDTLVLQPLMKLPQDLVLVLMEFLSSHVHYGFLSAPPELWLKYEDSIDWLSLILDTHFTRLTLIPSLLPKIVELRDNVRKQMKVISNLSILGAINSAIKTSNQRDNGNWLYKLDRIEMDF